MESSREKTIKVLIVDDSSFVRTALTQIIKSEEGFEVVGRAVNGKEGVEMAQQLKPDIITLDIIMPEMDGLEALKIITKKTSAKVIMISSLTKEGANATFDALAMGAIDFICKSMGDTAISMIKLREDVVLKLKEVAGIDDIPDDESGEKESYSKTITQIASKPIHTIRSADIELIGIGVSTGGPAALQKLIPALPSDFPLPIIIIQHMPVDFIEHYATRLNKISSVNVQVAREGQLLVGGQVLVAPGKLHMRVKKDKSEQMSISLDEEPADSIHRPSVDETFSSMASTCPKTSLGIILTGMGQDGLIGSKNMKKAGSFIFAEHKSSCVVYGMPKAIVENGLADKIVTLPQMPAYMLQAVKH